MNLHLCNGTEIIDADLKLIRFMENEYDLYDGVEVSQDSTLSLFDILLSIMMNSRLDTADKVKSIWEGRGPVEAALSHIPSNIALQDANTPWDDLNILFDAFCGVRWAGPAVSTKILYKKRPSLIPIYDSVIGAYIDGCNDEPPLPRGSSPGAHMVRGMKCFHKMLMASIDEIEQLRGLPEMSRFAISPMRVLEVLLWIENEAVGYYRLPPTVVSA